MATPNSRKTLIDYCKRQLGAPVIKIDVSDDQVSDRIDDAFQYYRDYHMDAVEKTYLRYQITQQDIDNKYIDITRCSGTVSVNAGSNVVTGYATIFTEEMKNAGAIITINGETKQVVSVSNTLSMVVNSAFINTATGVNMYVPKTDDTIVSVTRMFTLGDSGTIANMFDLRYQLRLNELYDFTQASYIPFVITMQQLRALEMLFIGEKEIRFNRHTNRLYLDFEIGVSVNVNEWLVFEAYRVVDANFSDIYNDRWIKRYATQLIKRQWGSNLKKYNGVALVGGVTMNGQTIYEEAIVEIDKLEQEIEDKFSYPPSFILG